jgi:hypothetical protein
VLQAASRQSPVEIRKKFSLAATCKLPVHRTQAHPGKQDSAHADRDLQKTTQRRTGVRMRHRRTYRPAKQERMGMGDPILASGHRRPLLFTRTACCFCCSFFGPWNAESIVRLVLPALLLSSVICLAAVLIACVFPG